MIRANHPHPTETSRASRRLAFARSLASLVAAAACVYLLEIVRVTAWTLDADEAVHAVEALRLHEDLANVDVVGFVQDTYFPERWAPPVHPHLRWYPFVHSWSVLPAFLILGPSDFSARLPSIAFLFATTLVFFALARRLSRTPAASGLLAVLLVLGAPNLLTFSAQSMIATASLFFSFGALYAYLVSLEADHPPRRAVVAGIALGLAMLCKYDHGGILALSLGLSELVRVRFSVPKLLRSGATLLFGIALGMVVLWFAHPDKLQTLADSAAHPFFGTPRTILLDFVFTWIVEYGASLAVGLCAVLSFFALLRRRAEPAMRAVLLWALVSTTFYALRGRFHFRYNFVEAPIFLLLASVAIPAWVERIAGAFVLPHGKRQKVLVGTAWVLGALGLLGGLLVALRPTGLFEAARGPFRWFHGIRTDHWGMQLDPDAYVDHFVEHYHDFAGYLGSSVAALSFGVFLLASTFLVYTHRPGSRDLARIVAGLAFAAAFLPGWFRLYRDLPRMVEWELECHPELNEVYAFVAQEGGARGTTLLGGGWDQLTNNALRWYLLTGEEPSPGFDEVRVVGDMIGSIVFPSEERVAYWAEHLATAPTAELPERIVLVEPGEDFLYRTRIGPEVGIYREVAMRRGSYLPRAKRSFPTLGCTVEVLERGPETDPIDPPLELLRETGVMGDTVEPESSRRWVGEGGWALKDESLRHFISRSGA